MKIAVICSGMQQFRQWGKGEELKPSINGDTLLKMADFIEYVPFLINEPKHRVLQKLRGTKLGGMDIILDSKKEEAQKLEQLLILIRQRLK